MNTEKSNKNRLSTDTPNREYSLTSITVAFSLSIIRHLRSTYAKFLMHFDFDEKFILFCWTNVEYMISIVCKIAIDIVFYFFAACNFGRIHVKNENSTLIAVVIRSQKMSFSFSAGDLSSEQRFFAEFSLGLYVFEKWRETVDHSAVFTLHACTCKSYGVTSFFVEKHLCVRMRVDQTIFKRFGNISTIETIRRHVKQSSTSRTYGQTLVNTRIHTREIAYNDRRIRQNKSARLFINIFSWRVSSFDKSNCMTSFPFILILQYVCSLRLIFVRYVFSFCCSFLIRTISLSIQRSAANDRNSQKSLTQRHTYTHTHR